jgi:hypothetical protein
VGPRAGLNTEARGKILSSLPGIDPRSPGPPYPMDTGGLFPGGKARPRGDADHSPPTRAEVENE